MPSSEPTRFCFMREPSFRAARGTAPRFPYRAEQLHRHVHRPKLMDPLHIALAIPNHLSTVALSTARPRLPLFPHDLSRVLVVTHGLEWGWRRVPCVVHSLHEDLADELRFAEDGEPRLRPRAAALRRRGWSCGGAGASSAVSSLMSSSLRPDPTAPAQFSNAPPCRPRSSPPAASRPGPARRPSPGMWPPITNSWRFQTRSFTHSPLRLPLAVGAVEPLGDQRPRGPGPARPRATAGRPRAGGPGRSSRRRRRRAPRAARGARRREGPQVAPVEVEQVEGDEVDRACRAGADSTAAVDGQAHPPLDAAGSSGTALARRRATTSPSRTAARPSSASPIGASSG